MLQANEEYFGGGGEMLEEVNFHALSEKADSVYPRLFASKGGGGGYKPLTDNKGNLLVYEAPYIVLTSYIYMMMGNRLVYEAPGLDPS